MLNFLPILLITSMLSKNGNGDGLSKETLLPIIKSLGMDENLLNTFFNNSALSMIKDGNFSLEKLLPLALSMMNKQSSVKREQSDFSKQKNGEEENLSSTPNYLKPISNIASDEVNYALSHYFANN